MTRLTVMSRVGQWLRRLREAALVREDGGAVFVEYVTLLSVVTIGAAAATLTLGVPLIRLFKYQQAIIVVPIP